MSNAMTSQVKPIWPHDKSMSPQDLFNVHIRIKILLPITKVTQEFDKFQEICNNHNLAKVIDETIITEDETIELENETWWDLMNDGKRFDKELLFFLIDKSFCVQNRA